MVVVVVIDARFSVVDEMNVLSGTAADNDAREKPEAPHNPGVFSGRHGRSYSLCSKLTPPQ